MPTPSYRKSHRKDLALAVTSIRSDRAEGREHAWPEVAEICEGLALRLPRCCDVEATHLRHLAETIRRELW